MRSVSAAHAGGHSTVYRDERLLRHDSSARSQALQPQREHALQAMAEIVAERGLRGASILAVTRQALISRAVFKQLFVDVEGCFTALVGQIADRAIAAIERGFESEPVWTDGTIAGLEALLLLLDADPALARIGLLDSVSCPPAVRAHWPRLVLQSTMLLDRATASLPASRRPPEGSAEAMLAAVTGILRIRLITGQAPPFASLLGDLAELILLPCVGPKRASEAKLLAHRRPRPLVHAAQRSPSVAAHLLPKQVSRSNAHKARAVLRYVSQHPGASNKDVSAGAGVPHLGQISVLLARLEQAGLLTKQPGGAGRPNAWTLSGQGAEAMRALGER